MAWQGQAGPEDAVGGSVGGISAEVRMDSAPLAADMARVNGMLTSLESKLGITAAAATNLDAGLKQATSGMTSFGSRMMIVGQFADDLQYGLRAVVNQIPQAAMAFGAGAGLAGVLSVAAVAANQLVNRWDDVTAAFGRSKTLTEAERMDQLGKKTAKSADEQLRLNAARKEEQQIAAMLGGQPAAVKATAAAVQGAFNESNPEAVLAGILAARQERNAPLETDSHLPGAIATRLEQLRTARRVAAGGGTEEEMVRYGAGGPAREAERLQGELNDLARKLIAARRKDAEREMLAATSDPGALLKTVRGRPDLFPAGTEGRLEDAVATNLIAAARRGIRGRKEIADEERAVENATAEKDLDLQAAHAEGQARRVEEDNRRRADREDPLITPGAAAKLQAARDREAQRLTENRQAGEALDAAAPFQKRADDLQERLRHLLNPEKQGQTLGGEAYFGSFHSTTAESPEAKQIREGNKLLAEIRENTSNLQRVQRVAR